MQRGFCFWNNISTVAIYSAWAVPTKVQHKGFSFWVLEDFVFCGAALNLGLRRGRLRRLRVARFNFPSLSNHLSSQMTSRQSGKYKMGQRARPPINPEDLLKASKQNFRRFKNDIFQTIERILVQAAPPQIYTEFGNLANASSTCAEAVDAFSPL